MAKNTNDLSEEEIAKRKKAIFDAMAPRGQKRILRIGFEAWDPFQEPKDPIDIRGDKKKRTTQMLVREFLQTAANDNYGNGYARGALDFCLGIINDDERFIGMFDFARWYIEVLKKDAEEEDSAQ